MIWLICGVLAVAIIFGLIVAVANGTGGYEPEDMEEC